MTGEKKRILIVCPYPAGVAPSQRLKFEQYYKYFEENGYEIIVKPFIDNSFWQIVHKKGNFFKKTGKSLQGYCKRMLLLLSLRKFDLVYIHLWVTPFGPPIFEWLYSKLAKKMIYDIDDLVYLKFDKTPWVIRQLKGYRKPIMLMKNADHVITCTPHLDKFVKQYNNNTTDISSTINTDVYQPKTDYSFKERKPVIGWSGSHSTVWHMQTIFPVLKKLKQQIDFKLLIMGTDALVDTDLDIECLAWKEEYEVTVINRFDIGIYPLPDKEFVLGKSSLKALQYMAVGIPTVATAIGTNFRVIENGVNGILVNTGEEWIEALKKLIENEDYRKRLGENAAERVKNLFSVNASKDIYLHILDNAAGIKR
ncbi:glycosyltransferase family 4 protein [Ferruginibacter sp.]